ncbi:MAG: pilus (MSHA type) biogenesis protein MshL [Thalassotalea sp.]
MNFKNKKLIKLYLLSLILTVVGCQSSPDVPVEINKALDNAIESNRSNKKPVALTKIPDAVQQDLVQQSLQQARNGLLSEKRLEVSASNIPAKNFFAAIVEDSPYSAVVHPDVSGDITVNLKEVTIEEVLDIVQESYGYDIRKNGRIIHIFPAGIRTETMPLNYLFIKRFGLSSTTINSGGVSGNDPNSGNSGGGNNSGGSNGGNSNRGNSGGQGGQQSSSGINIYTENESDFWSELKETLMTLVGEEEGRTVVVSPQAGLVTVKALPHEIKAVKKFLNDSQEHLRRQVIIEAKILEVTLNDDYQQGIRWEEVMSNIGSTDLTFGTTGNIASNAIAGAIGGASTLTLNNSDFSGVITLLQTQGNVQVLSSPRITATNNQKAVIKVGQDEYFVTEVSSTTTTGTSTTTTPEIELTPFFSGIALDVTPQINELGEVILHVHPSVTVTDEQIKQIRFADEDIILPLAQSSVRESDTIIRANSGEIVVIGGLIESRKVNIESKTPLLGDIPYFGELFKSKSETMQKSELVIMLRPIVTGQEAWNDQLQDARDLLKQWFPEEDK